SSRFLPSTRAALITPIGVLGVAMKNLLIGTELPAAGPAVQDGPAESWRSAGTKTLQAPAESVVRNGFSCDCGLVSRVVYGAGPPGSPDVSEKLCGGAPGEPTNTWSQTPFVQPSRFVLRTRNCC